MHFAFHLPLIRMLVSLAVFFFRSGLKRPRKISRRDLRFDLAIASSAFSYSVALHLFSRNQ